MSQKIWVVLNTISLLGVFIINSLANAGELNGQTVGEVSWKYDTLFTPAGYTFSVWGVIYAALAAHVLFQWFAVLKKVNLNVIDDVRGYFLLANVANVTWILLWINEYTGFSVVAISVLLWSLIQLMFRLRLEIWDAPVRIIAFVWWPFAIYLGWIIAATISNFAAFFVSIGWNGAPLSPQVWTILMILMATLIYLWLIFERNLRESAIIGIWAFAGIAEKQWHEFPEISIAAVLMGGILFAIVLYKAFKNMHYNPILKIRRGEF